MFYNTNYEITYHKYMNENPDKADVYYKKNLIEVFNLDEDSDFDLISDRVGEIYKKMKPYIQSNKVFKELLLESAAKIMSTDTELGYMILHSYDTLYLIHKLNTEFLTNNTINDSILRSIKEKI